jgi:DNA polymerase (family 10)
MRRQYKIALGLATEFVSKFVKGEYAIAGSIRRQEPTIGDVDIIVSEPLSVITKRVESNSYAKKVNGGEKKMDIDYKGMRFNIYHSEIASWGAMLFFLTGPAGYQIAYRRRAKEKGWKLDQYGLWGKNGELLASRNESHIYRAFGKEYKAPELRGK